TTQTHTLPLHDALPISGGIIQQGGTILGSARCPEFKTETGRNMALRAFNEHGIEALVVIGGNGSQTGSHALSQMGFPVVGVASRSEEHTSELQSREKLV